MGAAPGASAAFDARGSTDAGASITDYTWDFGDGTAVTDAGPSATITHTFANRGKYNVTLIVTNDRARPRPTASGNGDGRQRADRVVHRARKRPGARHVAPSTRSSSRPGTGGSISRLQLGLRRRVRCRRRCHGQPRVLDHRRLQVTLTVTDDLGVSSTATKTIIVDQPNPSFTAPQAVTAPGSDASFDPSASTDPEGVISGYSWDFGDDSPPVDTGTSSAITHTYADRGNYTVTLTITNGYGQTDEHSAHRHRRQRADRIVHRARQTSRLRARR